MTDTTDWSHLVFSVAAGLGVLLIGIGIVIVCSAIAGTLKRLNTTLDVVDKEISALSAPVVATLGHVGGIADTADLTLARLGSAVSVLESVAGGVAKTSGLANDAVAPAIINIGAALTGLSAGLRSFLSGSGRRVNVAPFDGVAPVPERIVHE